MNESKGKEKKKSITQNSQIPASIWSDLETVDKLLIPTFVIQRSFRSYVRGFRCDNQPFLQLSNNSTSVFQ